MIQASTEMSEAWICALKNRGCFAEEYANNENNGKGAVTQTKKSFVRQPLFICSKYPVLFCDGHCLAGIVPIDLPAKIFYHEANWQHGASANRNWRHIEHVIIVSAVPCHLVIEHEV